MRFPLALPRMPDRICFPLGDHLAAAAVSALWT
jgi:hypothetical protein